MAAKKRTTKEHQSRIPQEVVAQREALIDEEAVGIDPGEEFEELFGERVAGWFLPAAGNVLQGVLEDTFETESKFNKGDDKKRKVFKIRVSKVFDGHPTTVIPSDPETDEQGIYGVAAKVGDLVGLDQKGFLKGLDRVVVGQEVWVLCLGKMPRSADYPQGAWNYTVRAKPVHVDEVTGEVSSRAPAKAAG